MDGRAMLLALACLAALAAGAAAQDRVLINCGYGVGPYVDQYGRTWSNDSSHSNSTATGSNMPPIKYAIPGPPALYSKAVFVSDPASLVYNLRVHPGRHFVRLHFAAFPTKAYPNPTEVNEGKGFAPCPFAICGFRRFLTGLFVLQGYFNVTAQGVQLLEYFNVVKAAQAQFGGNGLYEAVMKEFSLVVPSDASSLAIAFIPQPNSFALICGIEVLSINDDMYDFHAIDTSNGKTFAVPAETALATAARLKCGGPIVTPANDTITRTWFQDDNFLTSTTGIQVFNETDASVQIQNTNANPYFTPILVAETDREIKNSALVSNLTYTFTVDPNFLYYVRFHFCENEYLNAGQRIMDIYINGQLVAPKIDISGSDGPNTATVRDFVYSQKIAIMVITLAPSASSVAKSPFVNGIEVLKMGSSSLTTPGPLQKSSSGGGGGGLSTGAIIGIIVGSLVAFMVFKTWCMWYICCRRSKTKFPPGKQVGHVKDWSGIQGFNSASNGNSKGSRGQFKPVEGEFTGREIDLSELLLATNDFDEANVIGYGGFGKVYRGALMDGTKVAIKRLSLESTQGMAEFHTEIVMLSALRHMHLVSLIGYCDDGEESALVYELMERGTLRSHLYGPELKPALPWRARLEGSFGYLDPEYFRRQLLTEKSDVYSFGVVLLEVLCARAAIDGTLPHKEANIVEWAWKFWKDDEFEEVLDQRMKGTYSLESVKKVAELAFTCLAEYGVDRPTMGEALWHLEGALTVQDSEMPHVELTIHPLTDLTVPASTGESGSNSPGTVDRTREAFSQLFETQGR
eukprot:SM000072S21183  [mRNA]  locus=s72:136956:142403:- [translate_table: standard]